MKNEPADAEAAGDAGLKVMEARFGVNEQPMKTKFSPLICIRSPGLRDFTDPLRHLTSVVYATSEGITSVAAAYRFNS